MPLLPLRTSRRMMEIGNRTLIMGIINVTPDSFSDSDGGTTPPQAIEQALRMAEAGADIIDIGGESTRPGSQPVSLSVELTRILPVFEALCDRIDLPLSVDTSKAEVARRALESGAEIINDISALRFDPMMAKTAVEAGAAIVLMHMRGTPQYMQAGNLAYDDVLSEIGFFFRERINYAVGEGIREECIILDPGLGFGKSQTDNYKLLRNLPLFKSSGRPLLTGVSRKSFTRCDDDETPRERTEGTMAAVTASILYGSHIVRVHDVAAVKKLICVADRIVRS